MQLFPQSLLMLAETVLHEARSRGMQIVTAESCTGGLIAGCLTEIPGCSDVFDRGFVVYSYDSKTVNLGVPAEMIVNFGAVSAEVALAMAKGALHASKAGIAVSATGIAGPGGGMAGKPVGLVYIGIAIGKNSKSYALQNIFEGDRTAVRLKTVETALALLRKELEAL
ncbi:MAG: CinA family protein [Alphaproteobacteria bacterium]|nr:CinA family protein [Alphaproteobacteria bacterium]